MFYRGKGLAMRTDGETLYEAMETLVRSFGIVRRSVS
jgi:hypothetical protein